MTKRNVFGVVAISAVVLGGQFVYFPVFADNPVNISIVELADDGTGNYKPWEDIVGAMPGETYSAIPRVRNDGEVPVGVRMCLSESAVNAEGETIDVTVGVFGIDINGNWALDNAEDVDVSDSAVGNCYRYNSAIASGNMTEPLFTEVKLSEALGNQYEGATFNLHLEADAVGDLPVVPDSPDTGVDTWVRNFVINSGLVFLTAGVLALLIVGVRKLLRK